MMPPFNSITKPIRLLGTYKSSGFFTFVFGGTGMALLFSWIAFYISFFILSFSDNLSDLVEDYDKYVEGNIKDGRAIVITLYFNKHHFYLEDNEFNYTQVFKTVVSPNFKEFNRDIKKLTKKLNKEFNNQFPGPDYKSYLSIVRLHVSIQIAPNKK